MLGENLADRRGAPDVGLDRAGVRRRGARRPAEQVREDEAAPEDRRGRRAVGGDLEHAGLGQDAAAHTVVGQRHLAHGLPLHPGYAVVLRQAAIEKGEVGVDQVPDSEIALHEFGEEQPGFFLERVVQQVVVLGIEPLVGIRQLDLVEPQPLADEVRDEALRLVVVEHSLHMPRQHLRLRQRALSRRREELLVGQALPQEVRKARRQREVVQLARPVVVVEKLWRAQQGAQGNADGVDELPSGGDRGLGQARERVDLTCFGGPSKRQRHEVRDDIHDVLVRVLRELQIAGRIELDAVEDPARRRWRPRIEERSNDCE